MTLRPLFLVFAIGCGSSDPAPDAGLSAAQACADVSAARCERLMACSSADLAVRWGDVATCETREALACTAGLAAPATAATPQSTEACATALTAQTCGELLGKAPPDACLPTAGPGAIGAACSVSAQCASQFCAVSATALCGTCQAEPQVGASCATSGCGPTLTCVASTMTCQQAGVVPEACSRAQPCGSGLSCVGSTMTASGVCEPSVTMAGGTCDPQKKTGPDCSAPDGLTCDHSTKQCVAQPVVASGACGLVDNVEVRCSAAATCAIPAMATSGTCIAVAADGAACDSASGPDCEFPARCVASGSGTAGSCQLPGSVSCP